MSSSTQRGPRAQPDDPWRHLVGILAALACRRSSGANIDHLPEYMDAKQYQTASSRSMLLLYRPDGSLLGSRYRGEPEPRKADRDAEIALAPLHSLAATFSSPPPRGRQSKKQRRGKPAKKKRRR
jgi:hypothetical protein